MVRVGEIPASQGTICHFSRRSQTGKGMIWCGIALYYEMAFWTVFEEGRVCVSGLGVTGSNN